MLVRDTYIDNKWLDGDTQIPKVKKNVFYSLQATDTQKNTTLWIQ